MKCAIYYGSGDFFEGEALDAPSTDVGVIVYADPSRNLSVGRHLLYGWDYYLLKENGWMGVNGEVDLVDHLLHAMPSKVLKGRMYTRDVWENLLAEANKHPGFPQKSAQCDQFEFGRATTNRDGT